MWPRKKEEPEFDVTRYIILEMIRDNLYTPSKTRKNDKVARH